MNSKRMIARLAAATMLLAFSVAGNAQRPVYDYAKVISAQPIIRYVSVKTPVRECWQDTEYYTTYHRPPGAAGSTLAGAIIGGVVGHQFGSGSGNDAATVAGTLIGAAIGNNSAHRRAGVGYGPVRYSRPVERCGTRYRDHREQRIDGYNVVYRYHGQKYATRMPYDPGDRIKVRIDIRPAG
ncbi:MAG: glycine zipper 2TM domain-containing protein [Gammaproteobacteria bacterium]|nr:glycine zipper 2TM domain-containing protein [Gammaproteobacteria bacterium]MDH3750719.1 glycine zipper 2TM domain-containing protein [Gammaproteobacteria bacterium]MDH3804858.1 glycine zipper 2TM domain-containing protein [Gammaproteobacteria bacterium]